MQKEEGLPRGPHDLGGVIEAFGPVKDEELTITAHWQSRVDALATLLFAKKLVSVDEFRRFIESLPSDTYVGFHYYGKWATAILQLLLRKGLLAETDVHRILYGEPSTSEVLFKVGQRVKVKRFETKGLFRRPHIRTPGYLFGKTGTVEMVAGSFLPPEQVSWNRDLSRPVPVQPLYRLRFAMGDIWQHAESPSDTVDVEVFQEWLKEAHEHAHEHAHDHDHGHSHSHGHSHEEEDDHGHTHDTRTETERVAVERETNFSLSAQQDAIAECLLSEAVRVGILTAAELLETELIRDSKTNDPVGPNIVARAWLDSEFKAKLLQDGSGTLRAMGVEPNCKMVVFENTPQQHNLIVCTLCSCYPTAILGRPPAWYKSRSYRARAVFEPRKVITELGGVLPEGIRVAVHDSTADLRYFVIPMRPVSSQHITSADELAKLVDRDSMIGLKVLK